MSRYATEQEVFDDLGKLLTEAAADEKVSLRLKEADAVVQYRVTDPDATLTLDARKKSGAVVELGETKLEPEIVLSLAADTAADLLKGDLNLTAALASGAIATKGPVTKVLRLLPVMITLGDTPEAQAEPEAEPESSAESELAAEPEASAESESEPSESGPEPADAEPEPEPAPEPEAS